MGFLVQGLKLRNSCFDRQRLCHWAKSPAHTVVSFLEHSIWNQLGYFIYHYVPYPSSLLSASKHLVAFVCQGQSIPILWYEERHSSFFFLWVRVWLCSVGYPKTHANHPASASETFLYQGRKWRWERWIAHGIMEFQSGNQDWQTMVPTHHSAAGETPPLISP